MKFIITIFCAFSFCLLYSQVKILDGVDCSLIDLNQELLDETPDSVYLCFFIDKLNNKDTSNYNATIKLLKKKYHAQFRQASYKRAGDFAYLKVEFGKIANDFLVQAQGLRELGSTYFRLGDFYKANEAYLGAMQIAQQNNDSLQISYLYRRQAWLAWRMYDPAKAIVLIEKFRVYINALKLGDRERYLYYNSVACFERRNENFERARALGDTAIHFVKLLNNKQALGIALSNRAAFYAENSTEDLVLRISLMEEALAINHEMNDQEQLGSNYGLMASIHLLKKEYEKSIFCYNKSLEYAVAISDRDRQYIVYRGLSRLYYSLGQFEKAYNYELKENNLYQELYGVQNITKVLDLQQKVAQAASQKQIDALIYEQSLSTLRENKIRNLYLIAFLSSLVILLSGFFFLYRKRQKLEVEELVLNQELADQIRDLEEKTLRSQMNPHFIFNSLNSIKSHIAKSEPRIATRYLTKFAHLMRLILQNSRATKISLFEEIKSLKLYIELEQLRLNHEFEFELLIDEGLDTNQAMIPPMILQPYVENAIWHGLVNKSGPKKLCIRIYIVNEKVEIVIYDNGIGRIASKLLNDNKVSDHKSFGMQITKERIEKNKTIPGMSIGINDLVDSSKLISLGTEVKIMLPLKKQIYESSKSYNY